MAFYIFAELKVDVWIVEVGMGGRLDSTNIISPLLSVITNIGFDHVQFLGNTLQLIASEKAGIIKPTIPVVIGEYLPETKPIFIAKANDCNSEIFFASDLVHENHDCELLGDYQKSNIKTVIQTIDVLKSQKKYKISEENINSGLLNVTKNTGLQGRWQKLNDQPLIIGDTAHNSQGLEIVLKQIQKQQFKQLHFVFGVVNDKDLDSILDLFPKNAIYYFCKPNIPRGLDAIILQQKCNEFGLIGQVCLSVTNAYELAKQSANLDDLIFIGGSTFVVSEIL